MPDFVCQHEGIETASARCQYIPGTVIDHEVGELLVELMAPLTLDVALQVQRAREEADLARQRFMQAHPDNRMVADVLEAGWNAKLRGLDEAQQETRAQPRRTGPGVGR